MANKNKILAGKEINFDRIVAGVLKYWYFILLSIVLSLSVSFFINRYSNKIYPVQASIMIKENQEMSEAEFIIKNALVSNYKNYYNELYIIKSYPLIEKAIRDLNLHVTYFGIGSIKMTEMFGEQLPITVDVFGEDQISRMDRVKFKMIDSKSFLLEGPEGEDWFDTKGGTKLSYGDTISLNKFSFRIDLNKNQNLEDHLDKWIFINFFNPTELAKIYSNRLLAEWAEEGASVVNLRINGENPIKESTFLSYFIKTYQQYDIDRKNQVAKQSLEFLDDQLKSIGDSLRVFENQIEHFKEKNIITSLDVEAQRIYQKIEGLESEMMLRALRGNYYNYVTERLGLKEYDGIMTPQSVGIDDPLIAELIAQLILIQSEINLYADVERVNDNPILVEKHRQISQIKEQIIQAIKTANEAKKLDEEYILKQIKDLEKQLSKLPATERTLVNIQRNFKLRENLYIFLLEKRAEVGITQASATSSIIMINPPFIGQRIAPRPTRNYMLGLGGGLFFPIVLFLMLELLNDKIQSKEDIEAITKAPLLGIVGHNKGKSNLVVVEKPRSTLAEAFRGLRTNLNYFTKGSAKKVFMITSSIAGEGKTFTALNLATVFALSGKSTIIVGADLRRPKLFDDFNLANTIGISQYLSNMAEYQDIIQSTGIENLSLMPAGPVPPNPSELLMRPEMDLLIQELKKDFEYVLIDTPPVGLVADAYALNKYADHTIYVVRQNYTPGKALENLDEFIDRGMIGNVSVLLNDIKRIGPGYGYSYAYGYGYNYGYGKGRNGGYYED